MVTLTLHLQQVKTLIFLSDIGLTFGADGEKIEGDGSKLVIAAANLDLTLEAGGDVTLS